MDPKIDARQTRTDWYDNFMDATRPVEKTPEGFAKATVAVTSIGVFTYRNPDGTTRRELRLPEDVFKQDSMDTLALKPMTLLHPTKDQTPDSLLTPETVQALSCGSVGVPFADSYRVFTEIMVTRADAIESVLTGQTLGLSCGYTCDIEWTSGNWLGQDYDCIQRNIRYNHVALVPRPRAGDDSTIRLDAAGAPGPVPSEYLTTEKEPNMDYKKVNLDGVEYQAEAQVITALTKAQEQVATLNSQVDQLRTDAADSAKKVSTLEGERDSLKERLDAAEKEMPGKIAKAVQAQIDLMDKARAAGCEVRADMSEKELKTAVILKKFPKANLDGKDDNYIQARFDAACEAIAEDTENQSRRDAADLNPKDPTKKDPLTEAMQRYNARMDSAWSDSNLNKEA